MIVGDLWALQVETFFNFRMTVIFIERLKVMVVAGFVLPFTVIFSTDSPKLSLLYGYANGITVGSVWRILSPTSLEAKKFPYDSFRFNGFVYVFIYRELLVG